MSAVSSRRAAARMRFPLVLCLTASIFGATSSCSRKPPARLPVTPAHHEVGGHAPAVAYDTHGALHLVYVAADQRLMHRLLDDNSSISDSAVSPAGDQPDARGEVGPLLAIDAHDTLIVAYASKRAGGANRDLVVQRSRDGGETWTTPAVVNDDAKPVSHSFASLTLTPSGDAVAAWLDSRSGHQGVRTARIAADGTAAHNVSIDEVTCECCRTAMLTTSRGELLVAYRDHADGDVRNMSYAMSRDGGVTWSTPANVADDGWRVNGCPESGPTLTEGKDGTLWAAWFNGAANAIQIAALRNGSFSAPRVVATVDGRTPMVNHPVIATLADGRLAVAYEALRTNGERAIDLRVADALARQWSAPFVIHGDVTTPRFAIARRVAVLAYTRHSGPQTAAVVEDLREVLQ